MFVIVCSCACVLGVVREGLSQRVGFLSDAYWEAFFAVDSGDFTVIQ